MSHQNICCSRRAFLGCGVGTVAGLTALALTGSPRAHAELSDRFELSIHEFSVKKLLDDGSLANADYPAFVQEQFGFNNVEFAVDFCESLRRDLKQADAIADRSRQLGIKHRALLCGAAPALDAADASERKAAVQDHLRWAELAERLQCEFIRVRAASEGDRERQLAHATEGIGELCKALEKSSLKVLVENITGFSNDPDWLIALVQAVGKDRLGLIADFGNFAGDIYDGMQSLLPYTKSVCTKSWEFDQQGNETKIDFAKMMGIIKQSDFRGCIAIEYLGDEPVAGVRKTAELIKKFG